MGSISFPQRKKGEHPCDKKKGRKKVLEVRRGKLRPCKRGESVLTFPSIKKKREGNEGSEREKEGGEKSSAGQRNWPSLTREGKNAKGEFCLRDCRIRKEEERNMPPKKVKAPTWSVAKRKRKRGETRRKLYTFGGGGWGCNSRS